MDENTQGIPVVNKNCHAYPEARSRLFPAGGPSPHLRDARTTPGIMGGVVLALLPAALGSLYFFGPGVLPYYALSIFAALAADLCCQWLRNRRYRFDLSAIVTGALLAMSLPLGAPLWFPLLGSALAIVVGKELFGGLGRNFLNPALLGRAVLRLAFSDEMMRNPVPAPPFGMGGASSACASPFPSSPPSP